MPDETEKINHELPFPQQKSPKESECGEWALI